MKSHDRPFFACVLAPALPLQALVRSEPALAGRPLVSIDGEGTAAHIDHVTAAARALGLRVGMTPSHARSLAPDVIIRRPSPELLRVTRRALVELATSFSHSVQDWAPGLALLDATGHQHIHGSFELMGRAILEAATGNGLTVRTGFAAGIGLAQIAARSGDGVIVFAPGNERQAIEHLGIRVLNPSPVLIKELARLKISRVGELAILPAAEIGTRLGNEGIRLHNLARGIDDSIIENPVIRGDRFEECVSLDYTLDNLEPLMFLLSGAADRIIRRMDLRGLCPGSISLTLTLDPSGLHAINLQSSGMADNPSTISTLLHRALTKNPPAADVRGFLLAIESGIRRSVQGQLFGPPAPEPGRLRELTGKLSVIVGEGNSGSPAADGPDGDDAEALRPFIPCAAATARRMTPGRVAVMAFRRFNPPVAADVAVSEKGDGALGFRDIQGDRDGPDGNRGGPSIAGFDGFIPGREPLPVRVNSQTLSGRVLRAAGPWYADSGWWTDEPRAGAYYDVEVAGRGVFRLWHDLLTDAWFVDGIWD